MALEYLLLLNDCWRFIGKTVGHSTIMYPVISKRDCGTSALGLIIDQGNKKMDVI